MGFFDLFKPKAETISNVGDTAKGLINSLGSWITGDIPAEQRAEILSKALDMASNLLAAQSNIVVAEAQGRSWLQRNWRPITMLTFLTLVVLDAFAILPNPIAKEMWTLLQIGLGGYVVGRSAEKIVTHLKKTTKSA